MRITQLAALIELPEQAQIGSCSALFNLKPFACLLQLVHVVGGDLFLQRRILNHGSVDRLFGSSSQARAAAIWHWFPALDHSILRRCCNTNR